MKTNGLQFNRVYSGFMSSKFWQVYMSHLLTKPTKCCVHPAKTDQPGHPPSLIRIFTVRMKKAWFLCYPVSAQWRLIRLGGCPGWSESSLGAKVILLVLSWGSSVIQCDTKIASVIFSGVRILRCFSNYSIISKGVCPISEICCQMPKYMVK